jgi:hypothetical protein
MSINGIPDGGSHVMFSGDWHFAHQDGLWYLLSHYTEQGKILVHEIHKSNFFQGLDCRSSNHFNILSVNLGQL